jgi:hypothetical protein
LRDSEGRIGRDVVKRGYIPSRVAIVARGDHGQCIPAASDAVTNNAKRTDRRRAGQSACRLAAHECVEDGPDQKWT